MAEKKTATKTEAPADAEQTPATADVAPAADAETTSTEEVKDVLQAVGIAPADVDATAETVDALNGTDDEEEPATTEAEDFDYGLVLVERDHKLRYNGDAFAQSPFPATREGVYATLYTSAGIAIANFTASGREAAIEQAKGLIAEHKRELEATEFIEL